MLEQVEIPGTIESFRRKEEARETIETVKISTFKHGMRVLEQLYIDQQEAAEHFAASVKAIAETSGLKPAVIRKVVKAKADAKLNEARFSVTEKAFELRIKNNVPFQQVRAMSRASRANA